MVSSNYPIHVRTLLQLPCWVTGAAMTSVKRRGMISVSLPSSCQAMPEKQRHDPAHHTRILSDAENLKHPSNSICQHWIIMISVRFGPRPMVDSCGFYFIEPIVLGADAMHKLKKWAVKLVQHQWLNWRGSMSSQEHGQAAVAASGSIYIVIKCNQLIRVAVSIMQ